MLIVYGLLKSLYKFCCFRFAHVPTNFWYSLFPVKYFCCFQVVHGILLEHTLWRMCWEVKAAVLSFYICQTVDVNDNVDDKCFPIYQSLGITLYLNQGMLKHVNLLLVKQTVLWEVFLKQICKMKGNHAWVVLFLLFVCFGFFFFPKILYQATSPSQ